MKMLARHGKKHRSTRSSQSLSIFSSLTMGRFCELDLHTKSSNCFCAHDFADLNNYE